LIVEFGFYLKKFISFFIDPFGFSLTLLFIGIYFLYKKDDKKIATSLISLSLFILILFSYPPFSNLLVKNLENNYSKYNFNKKVTYIHVLGNGHNTDKKQPISSHLSDAGTKRVLEGIILYKNNRASKLIFTGYDGGTGTSNASMSAKLALALDIKREDIIYGKKELDTMDEALFCKSIVQNQPFILVTSATHMPRAMSIFKSLGLHPIAAPTDFHRKKVNYFQFPNTHALSNSSIAMHEYFGILWSLIIKVFS